MFYSMIASLLMAALFLAGAAWQGAQAEDSAAAWFGVALGAGIGVLIVSVNLLGLKRMVRGEGVSLSAQMVGGMALKFIGLGVIGAALWFVRDEAGQPSAHPAVAFFGYLAAVFLGYAIQTKMVEARRGQRPEQGGSGASETSNRTRSDAKG